MVREDTNRGIDAILLKK